MADQSMYFTIRLGFLGEGSAEQVQQEYGWFLIIWDLINQDAVSAVNDQKVDVPSLVELGVESDSDELHTLIMTLDGADTVLGEGELVEAAGRQLWVPTEEAEARLDQCIDAVICNLLSDGESLRLAIDEVIVTVPLQNNSRGVRSPALLAATGGGASVKVHKGRYFADGMKGGIRKSA